MLDSEVSRVRSERTRGADPLALESPIEAQLPIVGSLICSVVCDSDFSDKTTGVQYAVWIEKSFCGFHQTFACSDGAPYIDMLLQRIRCAEDGELAVLRGNGVSRRRD